MKMLSYEKIAVLDEKVVVEMTVGEVLLLTAMMGVSSADKKVDAVSRSLVLISMKEKEKEELIKKIKHDDFGLSTYLALESITERILER